MNREEIILNLKKIVQPYVQDQKALENINEESNFINDLKINSANFVDIILDIEQAYEIEIDDESIEKMQTIKAAADIINAKLNGK